MLSLSNFCGRSFRDGTFCNPKCAFVWSQEIVCRMDTWSSFQKNYGELLSGSRQKFSLLHLGFWCVTW